MIALLEAASRRAAGTRTLVAQRRCRRRRRRRRAAAGDGVRDRLRRQARARSVHGHRRRPAGFRRSAAAALQIAGPTGAFIVILAGITAEYGIDGLQIATLLAGVMLLLLGIARLGAIIKFIPDPVIVGFTAGIAVIIWIGQWQDFFGLPAVSGAALSREAVAPAAGVAAAAPRHHGARAADLASSWSHAALAVLKRVPGRCWVWWSRPSLQATLQLPRRCHDRHGLRRHSRAACRRCSCRRSPPRG